MKLPDLSSNEHAWLKTFFYGRNQIKWVSLVNPTSTGEYTSEVVRWLSLFQEEKELIPLVLPLKEPNNSFSYYICTRSEKATAQVVEELEAFFGRSYSDFDRNFKFKAVDSIERNLLDKFNGQVLRVRVSDKDISVVKKIFDTYFHLLENRPTRNSVGARHFGTIRADFEKSLLVGNEVAATAYIEELRSTGRLDAQNQKFLEIRLRAALGRWRDIIINASYIRSIVDLALPTRIHSDLIEAIYRVYLEEFEKENKPDEAIAKFRAEIAPKYAALFRTRRDNKNTVVLKAFLINELSKETPSLEYCQQLLNIYPELSIDISYVKSLISKINFAPTTSNVLELANAAFDEENYDVALDLFLQCSPSKEVLRRIIACARDIDSLTACEKAVLAARNYPSSIIAELPPKSTEILKKLEKQYQPNIINERESFVIKNWCDWANWVLKGAELKVSEDIAQKGLMEWQVEEFIKNPLLIKTLSDLLSSGEGLAKKCFQQAFPYIYEFFSKIKFDKSLFKPLYLNLLMLLAIEESVNQDVLNLAMQLIQTLLDIGLIKKEYEELLTDVSALWANCSSFKYLEWGIDVSEIISIYPSPDKNLALSFYLNVIEVVSQNRDKVNEAYWDLLGGLARHFGCFEHFKPLKPTQQGISTSNSNLKQVWKDKRLAIYTLVEQVAIQAKIRLEKFYPGLHVDLNNDHEATDKLVNLAKSADIFIFAWRASKHQAFYCIQNNRSKSAITLYPKGTGSASIIREVNDYFF